MRYPPVTAGEWIFPVRRGYRMACCDCGLVHILDFKHVPNPRGRGRKIMFRARRDNIATAALRREDRKRLEATA